MFAINNHANNNASPNSCLIETANMQPPYDLSTLSKMLNPEKVAKVLSIFLRDAPNDIQQMRTAYDNRVKETVYEIAHKLKGSSGHLKANNLFVLLQQIEITAKSERLNESVQIAIDAVECEYKKIEPLIQAELLRLI